MTEILKTNSLTIEEMKAMLDHVEANLLKGKMFDSLIHDVMEVGYWANEVLQTRVSFMERLVLVQLIERVKYLQKLYLQNILNERAGLLSKELKSLISDEAWRVFLRLEEVRGMELDCFGSIDWRPDFNLELIVSEQELNARLSTMKLKTY